MNKSNKKKINTFKKSIESTCKTISKDPRISLLFGDNKNSNEHYIHLPDISDSNYYSDKDIIRGKSDSASLIKRYHNTNIHKLYSPTTEETEQMFVMAEHLRCELLGIKSFPGIAQNLLNLDKLNIVKTKSKNEKLSKAETFKLGIKDHILKLNISDDITQASDPILIPLKKILKKQRLDFVNKLNSQTEFSKIILKLINMVENSEKLNEQDNDTNKNEEASDDNISQNVEENNNANIQHFINESIDKENKEEKENTTSIQEDVTNDDIETDTESSSRFEMNQSIDENLKYKVFTNKFDSITLAENLCETEEAIKLRKQLDRQTEKLDSTITILANKLQRKLLSKQRRWWEFDLEEGILDSSKLSRVIVSPENSLSYKKEKDTDFKDTVVSLLIDNSGSMRGRPITIAAISTDILVKTLERCGIKVEVLGFTTRTWKGGRARESWIKENKPEGPGRLNELLHIIYKNADSLARRSKKNFGIMLKEGLLKENIDGEALDWAFKRIYSRPEKRKILMVISDGAPVDDSTLSSNKSNYLDNHLKAVIKSIEKNSAIELLAIGIGHDVTRYYNKAVTILDVDDLGNVMSKQLINLF